MATTNRLKQLWNGGDMTFRIIAVNVVIFLAIRILAVVLTIGSGSVNAVLQWVEVPPTFIGFLHRPWTVFTYMWCHYDFLHILFNMLWLWWFGRLFMTLCTAKQLLALYIYGGVAGAALYIGMAEMMPWIGGAGLIGASASIMAIVIASAVLTPNLELPLLLIGPVKLKWIAVATVLIFALGLTGDNAGGHAAHIGGAAIGAIYAVAFKRGKDLTRPFNNLIDSLVTLKPKKNRYKAPPKYNYQKSTTSSRKAPKTTPQQEMDAIDPILAKIKKSGYASLTAAEKERLFQASSRLKDK
ncbi:MAG: rhomboid family intramembrane serine protease [Bacteroidales bacterium]|nr:rhomboid family intramembrane serine protease [Bacteroidales bacterium]